MEVDTVVNPIIRGGCFTAPAIRPEWRSDPQYATFFDPKISPDQSPFGSNTANAGMHGNAVFLDADDEGAKNFWLQQRVPPAFLLSKDPHQQQQDDTGDPAPMDTNDDDGDVMEDEYEEVRNGDKEGAQPSVIPPPKKKHVNVVQLMHECRTQIGPRARLGRTSEDGKTFRLAFPEEGMIGEYLKFRIPNMTLMIQSGERTLQQDAEGIVGSSMMLCPPVHVSPLFLALNRDFQPCQTITDAITSIMRLSIVRMLLMEMDTADPAHKDRANKFRQTLMKEASSQYYGRVDQIVYEGQKPTQEREEKDARKYFHNLIMQFGTASDAFALFMIHIVEWNIMDILHIPFPMRAGLMTPDLSAVKVDPQTHMSKISFDILRSNLCNYLRNRNDIMCMKYEVDTKSGRFKTTKIIDPDAWQPMHLDDPRLEDRLKHLERYDATDKTIKDPSRIMYGTYHNWISLHTLREYMLFLSTDSRPKPKARKAQARGQLEKELEDGDDDESTATTTTTTPIPNN